jgi:RNA polymerase sigma factor (sigma-70 family)
MKETLSLDWMAQQQDQRISQAFEQDGARLRQFIRRRVSDPEVAEDILQDAFYELIAANRLAKQIENVSAWLFRVARNRIIDRFRVRKPEVSTDAPIAGGEDAEDALLLEDILPSPDAGPEAEFARGVLLEELEDALADLPAEQREVFVAHEIEGRSFRELAEESGISVNTLLSRKRYAVAHLRERLQTIYDEFTKR